MLCVQRPAWPPAALHLAHVDGNPMEKDSTTIAACIRTLPHDVQDMLTEKLLGPKVSKAAYMACDCKVLLSDTGQLATLKRPEGRLVTVVLASSTQTHPIRSSARCNMSTTSYAVTHHPMREQPRIWVRRLAASTLITVMQGPRCSWCWPRRPPRAWTCSSWRGRRWRLRLCCWRRETRTTWKRAPAAASHTGGFC